MQEKHIIDALESAQPVLSSAERLTVWNAVSQHLPVHSPKQIPSPFLFSHLTKHTMSALIALLILILGGGGTALASDAARPGDFLFPLDRAIENIELKITLSPESKEALTQKFTEERLHELRQIVDEEVVVAPSNLISASTTEANATATATSTLEIEARVFTDRTVIKIGLDDAKFYFEANTIMREGVIAAIQTRFPMLTTEQVDAQLDFKVEERESRPQDRGIVSISDRGEQRINTAVEAMLSFLNDTGTEIINPNNLFNTLASEVDGIPNVHRFDDRLKIGSSDGKYEIQVQDNGNSRVDINNGTARVRVEESNGSVRVKTTEDTRVDIASEEVVRTALTDMSSAIAFKVGAKVFTDTTIVKIEFNGQEFVFETTVTTRSAVVQEIHNRFSALTTAQIDAQLDFMVVDRASVPEDGGTNALQQTTPVRTDDFEDYEEEDENYEDEDEDHEEDEDYEDEEEDEYEYESEQEDD